MTLINFLTFAAFACVLIGGVMAITIQELRKESPEARIRQRMTDSFGLGKETASDTSRGDALFVVEQQQRMLSRWLEPKMFRLRTVAGSSGVRVVIAALSVGLVAGLLMARLLPLPALSKPLFIIGLPFICVVWAYRFLVERFRKRFLDAFPDLIDMIVRAVRAGVPVTEVIGTAANETPDPVKAEFKMMSDSLQVGRELDDVLGIAMKRIDIADFSFFCVCLMLQRETGGQLGETLENLSGIIRTRREVRQKTKALTAEARITTRILAAIPVVTLAGLYFTNRDYVMVLFDREAGHKLLTFALISAVFGIAVINKMSKLDTSR